RSRQHKAKPGTFTPLALDPQLPTMGLDNSAGDRQPQPDAAGGPRAALLAPVETLENMRQVGAIDPLAGIMYRDKHRRRRSQSWLRRERLIAHSSRDRHSSTRRRMADRVSDQVIDHSLDLLRCHQHRIDAGTDLPLQAHTLLLGLDLQAIEGIAEQVLE